MHHAQTVSEMADEVLLHQAKARAARTGEPLGVALVTILQTKAGRQLQELRDGPHRHERADEWQEAIARRRAEKRADIV
jgi:hypothetical protein